MVVFYFQIVLWLICYEISWLIQSAVIWTKLNLLRLVLVYIYQYQTWPNNYTNKLSKLWVNR